MMLKPRMRYTTPSQTRGHKQLNPFIAKKYFQDGMKNGVLKPDGQPMQFNLTRGMNTPTMMTVASTLSRSKSGKSELGSSKL